MDHGMDVARFNFSHGDHEEQHNRFELLKKVREAKNLPIAATLAARFVEQTIQATPASTPFGANFEPILPWLWQQL